MIPIRQGRGVRIALLASLALLVTGLALALGGCGDDDENPIKPDDIPSLSPTTPQNALSVLEMAYESLDSVRTRALYDSTYTGTSVDLNDPGGTLYFTYADEIAHVAALAQTPGLRAYLSLGTQATWPRLPSDDPSHPEWALIQISGSLFNLQIADGEDVIEADGGAASYQEFAFSPSLDSASPTDTLWKIVRWREVGSTAPDP